MSNRVFNFSAGPAMLPTEVLEASAKALVDYQGKGFGIAECSHRGKEFDAVLDEAIDRCKKLLSVPDTHDILFLQGGATQLFSTIPMNFLNGTADYLHVCSNETVHGHRLAEWPEHPTLVVDASSEMMSRPHPVSRTALIYAGAQKNLGPSGVVL